MYTALQIPIDDPAAVEEAVDEEEKNIEVENEIGVAASAVESVFTLDTASGSS